MPPRERATVSEMIIRQATEQSLDEIYGRAYKGFYAIMVVYLLAELFAYPTFTDGVTTALGILTIIEAVFFAWALRCSFRRDYILGKTLIRVLMGLQLVDFVFEVWYLAAYPVTLSHILLSVFSSGVVILLLFLRQYTIDEVAKLAEILAKKKEEKPGDC
jgi:hypothetical protein